MRTADTGGYSPKLQRDGAKMAAYRKSIHKSLLTIAGMAVLYWLGDGTVCRTLV